MLSFAFDKLRKENERLRFALSKQQQDIQQELGKALGYVRYCDDQVNFPGSTTDDGVFVGEHVAETLALECAKRIQILEEVNEQLTKERDDLRAYVTYLHISYKNKRNPVSYEQFTEECDP